MIFAIEGPDGCGKSTLFDALRSHPKVAATFIRMPSVSPALFSCMEELQFRETKLWEQLYDCEQCYICDRHPAVSAPVYDEVFNREPKLDVSYWHNCVVPVYLDVPLEVLARRLAKRGDVHVCVANLKPLVATYKAHIRKFRNHFILDGTMALRTLCRDFLRGSAKCE